ncbi:MAG: hypothetical protein FWG08_02395 [Propionibacteriaceae bacterium]|nr:hypothetical protein [Propionibacteriaceae bacterium]
MAAQVKVSLEDEDYRVVAPSYREAVLRLEPFLGVFDSSVVPRFDDFPDPGFEVERFLVSTYPGIEVWCCREPVVSTMRSAVEMAQSLNVGYVMRGGSEQEQRVAWARIVEGTMAHVTARDPDGVPVGSTGYQLRAELATSASYDTRIGEVLAGMNVTLVNEMSNRTFLDLETPDDDLSINNYNLDMGDWTL